MLKLDILRKSGSGKAARSTEPRGLSGAVFGGEGKSGDMACCLIAAKLS